MLKIYKAAKKDWHLTYWNISQRMLITPKYNIIARLLKEANSILMPSADNNCHIISDWLPFKNI